MQDRPFHYVETPAQQSLCVSMHTKRSPELSLVLAGVVNCPSTTLRWFLCVLMLIGLLVSSLPVSVSDRVTVSLLSVFCLASCVSGLVCRRP